MRDDNSRLDREPSHQHMANFGAFAQANHADIARDVSSRPDVVKDQKYVDNHPEFKTYLNANPEVRSELMANPESFVKGSQQYTNGSGSTTGSGSGTPKAQLARPAEKPPAAAAPPVHLAAHQLQNLRRI